MHERGIWSDAKLTNNKGGWLSFKRINGEWRREGGDWLFSWVLGLSSTELIHSWPFSCFLFYIYIFKPITKILSREVQPRLFAWMDRNYTTQNHVEISVLMWACAYVPEGDERLKSSSRNGSSRKRPRWLDSFIYFLALTLAIRYRRVEIRCQ